jgi:hypothetical protein
MTADNTTASNVVNLFTKTSYKPLTPKPAASPQPEIPKRNTKHAVQTSALPESSPFVNEIEHQRCVIGFISKAKAADLCGVDRRTWRRWESGQTYMPRAVWGWFQAATGGGFAAGGPKWDGWNFYRGEICTPEGISFKPGEIRSIPFLFRQIHDYERTTEELREETEWLKKEIQELRTRRAHAFALGQIDVLGIQMAQLRHEYRESEDPLIRELAEDMWNLLVEACEMKAKVLKQKKAAAQ